MAMFIWPFPNSPSAPPLLGVMALAVAAAAAILLAAGLLNLYGNPQAPTVQAQNAVAERVALVALYDATNGGSWTNSANWKSNRPLGDWRGVTTNASGRVTSLNLDNNNLTGTLPPELDNLSSLTSLALYTNNLSGTIPAELGNLSGLTNLNLQDNNLTGTIPAELGNLSGLINLNLRGNDLKGTIPANLGRLSNLDSLALDNNNLTGTVPAELGKLSSLITLALNGNQLTGQLPYGFTSFSVLLALAFQDNAGLCAPLDSAFQTWLLGVPTRQGDNCPPATIRSGTTAPVVGEPVTARLTSREAHLARIQATQQEYENNRCIGYDTSGSRAGITIPAWVWERADADSNDSGSPDNSTWAPVNAGTHRHATFVYLPQSGDAGKFLRASLAYGSPETTVTTDAIGPIAASNGLTGSDIVAANAIEGTLQVGSVLSVSLPADAEREDPAINPIPERWQWERSNDGSADWANVTPYHQHCELPDTEYPLTTDDESKYLRGYVYYNGGSSGSAVLKRGQSPAAGPVAP